MKKIKCLISPFVCILILLLFQTGFAQDLPDAKAERLQEVLDSIYQNDDTYFAGISAAVLIDNEGFWEGATGISSIDFPDSYITTDTLFHIYSVTKTFTAALILELMAEERLTLDNIVTDWISVDDYTNIDGKATIRQLLSHSSGYDDYVTNPYFLLAVYTDSTKLWTPEEVLKYAPEPLFNPGEDYSYSSTNYILLGLIAEAVTDSSIDVLFRTRFFDKLDLTRTFFPPDEDITGNVANPHEDPSELPSLEAYSSMLALFNIPDSLVDLSNHVSMKTVASAAWTTGAIVSTAEDIVHWGYALLEGDIISTAARDTLYNILTTNPILSSEYEDIASDAIGHDGAAAGFRASLTCIPSEGIYIVALINQGVSLISTDELHYIVKSLYNEVTEKTVSIMETKTMFSIKQIYPNPTTSGTKIEFSLQQKTDVILSIYNTQGVEVKQLINKTMDENTYSIEADLSNLPVGVYMLRLNTDLGNYAKKLIKTR